MLLKPFSQQPQPECRKSPLEVRDGPVGIRGRVDGDHYPCPIVGKPADILDIAIAVNFNEASAVDDGVDHLNNPLRAIVGGVGIAVSDDSCLDNVILTVEP